ncbi:MAG TPA: hypothetical protein VGO50_18430 [Pyrinomonadaceae bacterium]|nr:hypothetical protein [Pyrinomonadaceae bacterium]
MRVFAITILLLSAALLIACTGYFSGRETVNSNQANASANTLAENTNIDPNVNAELANANANIQNTPVKRPPPTPKEEPLTRTAPDDSVITAENNPEGDLVETRIFKNHDMLAKVERILTASRRGGSVRVFLKNGRVYEVPVARLKNVLNETPEEIIRTVGGETMATGSQPAAGKTPEPRPANTASTPQRQ